MAMRHVLFGLMFALVWPKANAIFRSLGRECNALRDADIAKLAGVLKHWRQYPEGAPTYREPLLCLV